MSIMSSTHDFTIIGGGINGLLTARELVQSGASVCVIDKSQSGRESSWAGGGILLPLYPWRHDSSISKLVLQSLQLYPSIARMLISTTGLDPEVINSGMLITHNPDMEAVKTWCITYEFPISTSSQDKLAHFSTDTHNPIWLPNVCQARNPRLLKALKQELLSEKVTFLENAELIDVSIKQSKISRITTSTGSADVNHLILTTGAWSGNLWQKFFTNTSLYQPMIFPIKGQMLLLQGEPGLLPFMVLMKNNYLIPRKDGKILVGSTVEHQGFEKQVTQEARNRLSAFANHFFPALQNLPIINHWAGIRPGTERGIPYIDRHPEIKNLSINAGHFRNGLAMAPASAQLLVDLILHRPTKVPPEPFLLSARH